MNRCVWAGMRIDMMAFLGLGWLGTCGLRHDVCDESGVQFSQGVARGGGCVFDEARESWRTTDDVECIATAFFLALLQLLEG